MNDNIRILINKCNKITTLEYSDNIFVLKDNVDNAIKEVKKRLGNLGTLKYEIDFQLTKSHMDNEEP